LGWRNNRLIAFFFELYIRAILFEFPFSDKIWNSTNTIQTQFPWGKEADFQQQKQRASLFFAKLTSFITALKFSRHRHFHQPALLL